MLFRGSGPVSLAIALSTALPSQWITGCAPSHIGICARHEGRVLLFESTTLCGLPCEINKRPIKGVQAHTPASRIDSYEGKVWRMRLAPDNLLTRWQGERLTAVCLERIGELYDYRGLFQTGTLARYLRFWRPPAHHLICSRYVAIAARDAGIVGRDIVPAKMSPAFIARQWAYEEIYQSATLVKG